MTWGGVAKPPVMPRGVEVGPHPWDCLRGILCKSSHNGCCCIDRNHGLLYTMAECEVEQMYLVCKLGKLTNGLQIMHILL